MSVNRRTFLTGVAAAGAGALIPGIRSSGPAFAQAGSSSRLFRIDTHTHFSIPKLYDLATARGVQQATLKDWTPAKMLQEMEEGFGAIREEFRGYILENIPKKQTNLH